MPTWLLSATFWKFVGLSVAALALAGTVWYAVSSYEHLKAEAAKVPGLEAQVSSLSGQIKTDDARVASALADMKIAQAQRDQAIQDLKTWQGLQTSIDQTLQRITDASKASTTPVCLPTDDERGVWNSSVAALVSADAGNRPAGASGAVPSASGGVHR